MSKRAAVGSSSGKPVKKRPKRRLGFGAPSADDGDTHLLSQLSAPSSTGLCTRYVPGVVPSLSTLCIRSFVSKFPKLYERHKTETLQWLRALPDIMIPRIFSMLADAHALILDHSVILLFLRGDPIVLSGALPGVSILTIQALTNVVNYPLRELCLIDLPIVSDAIAAKLFSSSHLSGLEVLKLSGCTKIGQAAVEAIAKNSKLLKVVNLSFTSAPPASIALLTLECLEMEVLKLAGVPHMNDYHFRDILHFHSHIIFGRKPLANLKSLKLRHTLISDATVSLVALCCRDLRRLDISFTPVRQPAILHKHDWALEKLSVTSAPLTTPFLISLLVSEIPIKLKDSLRILHLGALGASPTSNISTLPGNLTLTDYILESLTDVLAEFTRLESISLVGNAKLGIGSGALANFVRVVGRRCKILNLAGISRLKSSDLAGLAPLNETLDDIGLSEDPTMNTPSPLQVLTLNNTDVGDEAAPYIASCISLETLELAGTKLGYEALFTIVDSCQKLSKLDLTSCRGVKVGDRRRFFQIWNESRG